MYQPQETKNAKSNMRDITKTNIPIIFSWVKRISSDETAS
jgi:hypothetical protein